jgi:catechol 2,3-dioxygenase-like lactoylglutathione lyase family enzyme
MTKLVTVGLTIQLLVGDFDAATFWYTRLMGRAPDFVFSDFKEWEVVPDTWLQITASKNPGQSSRLRLGVRNIVQEKERLAEEFGIETTEIEKIEGAAARCNFQDPWGNRIGLFQDLAKYPWR